MDRVYSITLDFKETEKLITDITYKQYDYRTSYLDLILTFDGEPANLGNEVVVAVFKTSKGKIILDNDNKPARSFGYITNATKGKALLQIPDEVLQFPGRCSCEIVSFLFNGKARRTTQAFAFQVVSSITEIEPIEPPEEFKAIVGTFLCGQALAGQGYIKDSRVINYEQTIWQDGITPVNAINLNKIEEAISRLAFEVSNIPCDSISYTTEADSGITNIRQALDKLLYVPLTINFTCGNTIFEKGSILNKILFNWSYNKSIHWQRFNNVEIDKTLRTYTYQEPLSQNKTFTLSASDGSKQVNSNLTISFTNGRYWGVSNSTVYDSNFIKSLNKELNESRKKTFTVNCGEGQYVFYSFPSKSGTPTFTVGGFSGGFVKVATIQFENNYNFIESYDIWKSENSNLGNITVSVG